MNWTATVQGSEKQGVTGPLGSTLAAVSLYVDQLLLTFWSDLSRGTVTVHSTEVECYQND